MCGFVLGLAGESGVAFAGLAGVCGQFVVHCAGAGALCGGGGGLEESVDCAEADRAAVRVNSTNMRMWRRTEELS